MSEIVFIQFFIHFQPNVSFVIFLREIHESMNRSILNFYSKKTVTHTVTAHLLYWIQSNMIISTIPKEYRLQLQLQYQFQSFSYHSWHKLSYILQKSRIQIEMYTW